MMDNYDIDDKNTEYGQIPTFLLETDKSFQNMIKKVMDTASSINKNDLRQVAILTYQIANLHLEKQTKTIYLESGTGTLKESSDFELNKLIDEFGQCKYYQKWQQNLHLLLLL